MMFRTNRFILLTVSGCQMLGGSLTPVVFRWIVWSLRRLSPEEPTYKYMLENPRKICTLMYSSRVTKQILTWVVLFTLSQFLLFIYCDFHSPVVTGLTPSSKLLVAWFMSVSTRTGGFSAVSVSDVSVAVQVLYAIMMYLPITPVFCVLTPINVGGDNVDEREPEETKEDSELRPPGSSLALSNARDDSTVPSSMVPSRRTSRRSSWMSRDSRDSILVELHDKHLKGGMLASLRSDDDDYAIDHTPAPPATASTYLWQVSTQLEAMMSQELPYLAASLLVICIVDNGKLSDPAAPRWFGVWGVGFELAAAWGTAGLTLSPTPLCLSAYLHPFSQLIVMGAMIKARQRVPVAIDPNVELHPIDNGDLWTTLAAAGDKPAEKKVEVAARFGSRIGPVMEVAATEEAL
jgi:hypothetical protein